MLTPLALLSGCEDKEANAHVRPPPPPAAVAPAPVVDDTPKEPQPIGEFDVTFYFVASEEDVTAAIEKKQQEAAAAAAADLAAANDGTTELAAVIPELPPREIVPLYEARTCNVLAEVDKEFAKSLALQGTGRLKDGRLLNVAARENCACDRKPCFHEIPNQEWGRTGTGRALQPFRTVAVDPRVIKLNSLLYIPLLDGRTMPGRAPWGGFVHDGCVVADDTGGGIQGNQLDLFVGRKGFYVSMAAPGGSHAWARHVQVFDGAQRCERKGRRIGRKAASI
jgi:3D (Asp-Asp-Asp) domain-containing protein